MHLRFAGSVIALAWFCIAQTVWAQAQLPGSLQNGDLETRTAEGEFAPWSFTTNCDATLTPEDQEPFEGQLAARITANPDDSVDNPFTNFFQLVDATTWQGKTVRFRANVKTAELERDSRVQLWFRVDRVAGENGQPQMGAFDNMQDRPIDSSEWATFDIVLPIAEDATRLVIGMFIIGKGNAWLDAATLEVVNSSTPTTELFSESETRSFPQLPPAVQRAFEEAENAPQQPFFTFWLLLPVFAIFMFCVAMVPERRVTNDAAGLVAKDSGFFRKVAIRFTVAYWVLYCWPNPFSNLLPWLGPQLDVWDQQIDTWLVDLTAKRVLGLERELVPPNGSGDTTFNYLAVLNLFVIALVIAAIWTALDRRRTRYAALKDLLRSYLRYVLALTMLGYGLAKTSLEYNQFPTNGPWQLDQTWGDSSPMNVVWAFMGASRAYTVFAGLGEILGAVLLLWRRTATLGALVTLGVMSNVMMLNYCYDIPVKLYSTHLVVMAILIAIPDLGRVLSVFVLNRLATPVDLQGVWRGLAGIWTRRVLKTVVVLVAFVMPLAVHTWATGKALMAQSPDSESSSANDFKKKYRLTNRGFRWINEVPFNR